MAHPTPETNDPTNVTNPEHASHRIVTPRQYGMVYVTLLVFTGITALVSYVPLGWANPVVALAIATFKAMVVVLFFMHMAYQSRLIKMTVCAGFFMFFVLIVMTMSDYISRAWGMW
jgi:cytochrome c oxidase subunit 4